MVIFSSTMTVLYKLQNDIKATFLEEALSYSETKVLFKILASLLGVLIGDLASDAPGKSAECGPRPPNPATPWGDQDGVSSYRLCPGPPLVVGAI